MRRANTHHKRTHPPQSAQATSRPVALGQPFGRRDQRCR